MPRGTELSLEGMLVSQGPQLLLRTDEGSHWRLEAPRRAWALVGRRVRVEGVRDGHDLLAVRAIADVGAGGSGERTRPFVRSWQFAAGAGMVLVVLALAISFIGWLGDR